jgi:signal transduction histidine kinase/ActR/RegA family two-component response regulator
MAQSAFALALARAELATSRRRLLIALFAIVTAAFHAAGVRASAWVYAVFGLWFGIAMLASVALRRAKRASDADLIQTASYFVDATLLSVICALVGGGWWLAITVYAFVVTFAFATVPRPRAQHVAAYALFCFVALIASEVTGVLSPTGFAGLPPLRGNYRLALAVSLFGATMIVTFGVVQLTFVRVMRRAQERYRLLLQMAPDMILSVDRDGTIASANEAARLFATEAGYTARSSREIDAMSIPTTQGPMLIGSQVALLAHPDDREALAGDVDAAARGESRQRELRLTSNADRLWYLISCNPIREEDRITGVLVVARDISVRKRNEEALHRSEEALRQAQKMEAIGRLAGGVAHDFNNLLTVIGTYSELLLQGLTEGNARRSDVEEIYKATVKASTLTNQLLTFSRKQVHQPRLINLNEVVSGMETLLRRLIGVGIRIDTRTFAALPAMRADPAQMEQVLLNLAVNARDAMPSGGLLRIETDEAFLDAAYAAAHSGVAPGRYVLLSVSDTGHGMDEETRSRIFEPFFTTKGAGEGTGLGLATVYGIVQQSGGHIEVESEVGRGTTFRIYFPVTLAADGATVEALPVASPKMPPPVAAPAAHIGALRSENGETILLVEDGEALRDVLQRVLEEFGYRVCVARDGEEALTVSDAHEGPIHLLVTDVVMPHMGGRELAVEMWGRRPDTRVLFMSGYTEDSILQQGLRKRSVGFIGKPFRPEAFARKVREMLDREAAVVTQ